jgi:ketosteroid isomerase-like protein
MIDRALAARFAAEWIALWNARDLDAILAHYTEEVVFHSPRIAVVMGEPMDFVSGKPALRRYWLKALAGSKELRFDFERVYVGSDSLTIAYRNHRGQNAAETCTFNADHLVVRSIATYD